MQVGHELLFFRRRGPSPLVGRNRIVGNLAQGHPVAAPAALELSRVHVEYQDALPVDQVDLAGVLVEIKTTFGRQDVNLLIVLLE